MMSELGAIGSSSVKNATVFCSQCNTENEIQVANVQYTSSYTLIVCKSCEVEIVLLDDWDDPGTSSIATIEPRYDGSKTGLQQELESTDGAQEGVERPVGQRPKSHERKLKSSASCTECGSDRNGPMTIQHSSSLGTIAQNGSELTTESLKQLSDLIREHPCTNCGCTDRDLLNRVEGVRDVFYCHGCDRPYGIDDGMNFFDLQDFLNTGYRMDPCSLCGNDDPEKFTLELSSAGHTESTSDLVVSCSICKTLSPRGLAQVVEAKEEDVDAVEVSCNMECSVCQNKDSQKFEVQVDACNNTIETICLVCKNRNATEVSGQVCSCAGASVDYGFDEYGYINKVKCEVCGAVMNTSDDPQNKGNSSDGSSRGRMRIRSLDMVRSGDHIAWHQWLGYWHHAIVVEVQFGWINLIHYNGPSAHKGVIVEEWRELDPTKEEVYRIDYQRDAGTYDPKVVVERAKTRIGEHSYNLMTNNCEHFARWCVTGQHRSVQVQTFCDAILSRVKLAAKGGLAQSLTKIGLNFAKKKDLQFAAVVGDRGLVAGQMLLGSGDNAAKGICTKMTSGVSSVASGLGTKGLSAGFAVGYEIYSVIADIRKAHHQRADGAIDRNEFLKITIKRSCEGVGSLVGTAVTLAIPVANIYIGLTIGTIIGKAAGAIVGRNAACLIGNAASKN